MSCIFCKGVAILGSDPPTCAKCAEMLETHIGCYCSGCETMYWVRKTPDNIMIFCDKHGVPPQYVLDNPVGHTINACQRCVEPARRMQLVHSSRWQQ